jgi:hypothetical protein
MSGFVEPPTPNTSPETEKVEEVKTTFICESCKIIHPLEKAIRCKLCNINDDTSETSETETSEVDISEADTSEADTSEVEELSVDSWDGKIKHLFCKKCTLKCNACEERGCRDCVEFVCCDCSYNMCYECINNEVDCGCYGHCYSCRVDINRGSEGWPCGECEKWYCYDCRRCDNPCKECRPESDSESESESESDSESEEKDKQSA